MSSVREVMQTSELPQSVIDLEQLKAFAVQLPHGFVKREVVRLIEGISEQINSLQSVKEEKWRIRVRVAAQETILLTGLNPATSLKEFLGLVYEATNYSSEVSSILIDRTGKRISSWTDDGSLVAYGFQNQDSVTVEYGSRKQESTHGKIAAKLSSFKVTPSSPVEAVFLSLHCCLLDLGFVTIAPVQAESSVPGFAPPLKGTPITFHHHNCI